MAKYIKSYSKYVEKKIHQYTNDSVIGERDITTVGGFELKRGDRSYTYQDSSFIFKSNGGSIANADLRSDDWSGGLYTLENVSSVQDRVKTDDTECQSKINETKLSNYAYYGSCSELIRSSITDIIDRFPAEIFIADNSYRSKRYYKDGKGDVHPFVNLDGDEMYEVNNPFGINIYMPFKNEDTIQNKLRWFANNLYQNFEILIGDESFVIKGIEIENKEDVQPCPGTLIHDVYIEYGSTKESSGNTILISVFYGENREIVYLCSDSLKGEFHIRPKECFYTEFINSLSVFQKQLMNTKTTPKYKAVFEVMTPNEFGYKLLLEEFSMPIDKGGYNPLIDKDVYSQYIKRLSSYGAIYDEYFSDNIVRVMTHESIKNFDWSYTKNGTKVSSILRIIGREFDEIRLNAQGVSKAKITNYLNNNYTPNYLLSDYCAQDGWDVKNVTPFHVSGYRQRYGTNVWSGGTVTPFSEESVAPYSRDRHYGSMGKEDGPYYGEYYDNSAATEKTINLTISDSTFNKYSQSRYSRYTTEDDKTFNREGTRLVYQGLNIKYLSSGASSDYIDLPCPSGGTYQSKVLCDYTSNRTYNVDDVNSYFYKMLRMNSKSLLQKKGTIAAIEEMLGLFGFKSKRWASYGKDKKNYDYTIDEYTISGISPIIDSISGNSYYIERLNSYKLLTYNDDTNPYNGLMVRYYYKDENGKFVGETRDDLYGQDRYLFPYYNSEDEIDGDIKYQENGGWLGKNEFFSRDNKYIVTGYTSLNAYTETSRNIGQVDKLSDLISLPKDILKDGSIYKVNNLNTKYAILEGGLYEIYDDVFNNEPYHYVNLEIVDKSLVVGKKVYSNEYITVSDPRYYGDTYTFNPTIDKLGLYVRMYIDYDSETPFIIRTRDTGSDIMLTNYKFFVGGTYYDIIDKKDLMTNYFVLTNVENSNEMSQYGWLQMSTYDYDYHKVVDTDDYFEGNNPHRASERYDSGQKYIDYFDKIFKYSYDNNLIDSRCYGEDSTDLINMSEIGFHITKEGRDSWIPSASIDTKVHSFAKTNEYSGKTVTDDIMNTKLVKITFKVDYKLSTDAQKYFEQLKYFDKIINDYLTQMIPPCTILQVYINHG